MIPLLKSKLTIRKIFKNCNKYEDYYVKIYEIDDYFHKHYSKKIEYDKNDREYILFKVDIYFSVYSLAVDIEEKDDDKDLNF